MNTPVRLMLVLFLVIPVAKANEAPKERWINYIKSEGPPALCLQESYYKQCYTLTTIECEQAMTRIVNQCVEQLNPRMPAMFDDQKANFWASMVVTCAERSYEPEMASKKISNEKCDDDSYWQ